MRAAVADLAGAVARVEELETKLRAEKGALRLLNEEATARERLLLEAVRTLRSHLAEAIEDIEQWSGYASAYFQDKHDLQGCLQKHRVNLAQFESVGNEEFVQLVADRLSSS